MFSSFDCAVKGVRGGKEDPANAIIAGFLTGGTLAFRSGPKPMLVSAIGCGVLLGVFEGVGAVIGRVFARYNRPVAPLLPEQPQQAVRRSIGHRSLALRLTDMLAPAGTAESGRVLVVDGREVRPGLARASMIDVLSSRAALSPRSPCTLFPRARTQL